MNNKKKNNMNYEKSNIKFIVKEENELLKFLKESMPEKPSGKVKSMLEHRQVHIDGSVSTKYNAKLTPGQTVTIDRALLIDRLNDIKSNILPIIYEDADIIAVNKPAGLLTVATETEKEKTAYHKMTQYVKLTNPSNRIFIVHRLDRETSGVLIFAKNEEMKYLLQDHWRELIARRGYIAVVEGNLNEKNGRIESYLRETDSHLVYSATRDHEGKLAITDYSVIKESKYYSMLRVDIKTGRKNQIRVHMKEMGHPILGDKKYGSHNNPLKRLCLHADILEFSHPLTGKLMSFKASAPKSFSLLLKCDKKKV